MMCMMTDCYQQNNFPVRVSSIYVVNAGAVVKILMKFAKLFVKQKIIDRVIIVCYIIIHILDSGETVEGRRTDTIH